MIRFIDLGHQIYPLMVEEGEPRSFAWFNTIIDAFEEYCDNQVWDSWLEFETDFRHEEHKVYLVGYGIPNTIDRYKRLFPWKMKDEED